MSEQDVKTNNFNQVWCASPVNISLRDYFAACALQSLIVAYPDSSGTREQLCNEAYHYADAMLNMRQIP